MDIHKWLDETMRLGPRPCLPEQFGFGNSICPMDPEPVTGDKRKEKGRRRRSSSDSSLLTARPQRENNPPARCGTSGEKSANEQTSYSDASQSIRSRSSASTSSSQLYARRPRRKTRPDHYEPSSNTVKERGAHTRQHRHGESNKTQRKSRRRRTGKQGSGYVHSFRAKNVSNDRLTLKPREKLGIFNKGRASSPVRGRGLPDLVFSEMKFLQRHKVQPQPKSQLRAPKKRCGGGHHSPAKEEDVSVYFTSVRPVLADKSVNSQRKVNSHKKTNALGADHHKHGCSSVADKARSTTALSDEASHLGTERKRPHGESDSYISWSDSIRNSSTTPGYARVLSKVNGQLDLAHRGGDRESTNAGDPLHLRSGSCSDTRHTTGGRVERFQVSSGPDHQRASRAHSLSHHTSSPRPENVTSMVAKTQTVDTAISQSSLPPFISAHAETHDERRQRVAAHKGSQFETYQPSGQNQETRGEELIQGHRIEDIYEVDKQSSSSLGKLLQLCNTTFHEGRRAGPLNTMNIEPARLSHRANGMEKSTERRPDAIAQRAPTLRSSRMERLHQPPGHVFTGTRVYEQQAQRQQLCFDALLDEEVDLDGLHGMEAEEDEANAGGNDGMMVVDWDHEAEWESATWDTEEPRGEGWIEEDEEPRWTERQVVGSRFWRPHKLY